jgi:HPt (histidine-containing phosphotransfer) domain-containing protein
MSVKNIKSLQSQSIVDEAVLNNLKSLEEPEDKGKFFNGLIDTFIENTPPLMESLKKAFEDNNIKEVLYYSHRLKGVSANIGASKMQDIFEVIEEESRANYFAREALTGLDEEYKNVKQELENRWRITA